MTADVPPRTPSSTSATVTIVVVHAAVVLALLWWSWRKWPDPLVDFGRELYVPWQITRGSMLYRDLASLFGPLSPYVNALWFTLFGVSLTTLVICNVSILVAMTAGVFRLIAISTDRLSASVATLTMLLLCGFSQYIDVGNYNFVTPYAHEATHGIALSVGAIIALHDGLSRNRRRSFLLAGLCLGAVVLTKPEVAIAAGAALVTGAFAAIWVVPDRRRTRTNTLMALAAAMAVPLAFLAYFHFDGGMRWVDAARALATGWSTAASPEIAQNEFYRRGSGLDDITANFLRMLLSFAIVVSYVGAGAAVAGIQARRPIARGLRVAAQGGLLLVALLGVSSGRIGWALPLISVTVFGWVVARIVRALRSGTRPVTELPLLMWSIFAIALLPKMALNARIYHYGFFLTVPAVSAAVALLLSLVPAACTSSHMTWVRTRAFFAASTGIAIVPALLLSNSWYRGKVVAVGNGGDRFYVSQDQTMWQGPALKAALDWIDGHAAPDATLTALPEGVMINYLSRRQTPTRYINFMPPEAVAFGEHAMAQSLDVRSPDFLLLVHKNTSEYGYASFGSTPEYGGEILPWVRRHYRTVDVIGRDPADAGGYGIEILKRLEVRPD